MKPNSGWDREPMEILESELRIGEQKVMKRWEAPLMDRMARSLCSAARRGRILEIGYGLGISARSIEACNVERHTIVEAHPEVFDDLKSWAQEVDPGAKRIQAINDFWQNRLDTLAMADGIFFDTYCDGVEALIEENVAFLEKASAAIAPGTVIALFWLLPTLESRIQSALFDGFSRVEIEPVAVDPGATSVTSIQMAGYMLSILAIK